MDVIWISGASSGIGAAMARAVPDPAARLIGIGRRPPVRGEHVEADLSRPDAWPRVAAHFHDELASGDVASAVFVHLSGIATPVGPVVDADPADYTAAVLLNAASGQVLGQAFLAACRAAGTRPTLVLCSSPAAMTPVAGASHYGAGKCALEYWAAAVAAEIEGWGRVFSVVPFAVDTPMVRETIAHPEATPIAGKLREAAEHGLLASAETTAAEIWGLVADGATHGSAIPVGAVPAELRGAR
jgi:benzil reductase ((S)-benzoin forming)